MGLTTLYTKRQRIGGGPPPFFFEDLRGCVYRNWNAAYDDMWIAPCLGGFNPVFELLEIFDAQRWRIDRRSVGDPAGFR